MMDDIYVLVSGAEPRKFIDQVNAQAQEGYRLVGYSTTAVDSGTIVIVQFSAVMEKENP